MPSAKSVVLATALLGGTMGATQPNNLNHISTVDHSKHNSPEIVERYRDWSPPFDVAPIVRRLLSRIPEQYLLGLETVALTNVSGLNRKRRHETTRSRGRKVRISATSGLYHQAISGEPAWIELFVDSAVQRMPPFLLRIPLFQDSALATVLFHELGHHLHATQARAYREPEDVAESWKRRLSRIYFRRRYWYVLPFAWLIGLVVRPYAKWVLRRGQLGSD